MRLNNLSARLLVNDWLKQNGLGTLSADLSYLDFATELRRKVASKEEQAPFVERSDAVAYVRLMARTLPTKEKARPRRE